MREESEMVIERNRNCVLRNGARKEKERGGGDVAGGLCGLSVYVENTEITHAHRHNQQQNPEQQVFLWQRPLGNAAP